MKLPDLTNWENTKSALHQSLHVIRSLRFAATDPLPNYLSYSAIPMPYGGTSGALNFGGELEFHYAEGQFIYWRNAQAVFTVGIEGKNQSEVFNKVFELFQENGVHLAPDRSKIVNSTAFEFDSGVARDYAEVQWRMHEVLSRLKSRMLGFQTPVALWAHGFDISTLWFANGTDEHKDHHINFGFSPGTSDVGQPYMYFYAWEKPAEIEKNLPELVSWNPNWGTPGGYIPYERFQTNDNPEALLLETLTQVYNTVAPMLKR